MKGFEIRGAGGTRWRFGSKAGTYDGADPLGLRLVEVPEGVGGADIENRYVEAVLTDGAIYDGTKNKQNVWSLHVNTKGRKLTGGEAVSLFARWRMSMGRGELITVGVGSEGGGTRYQDIRLNARFSPVDLDLIEHAKFFDDTVTLISDSSWFYKADAEFTFDLTQLAAAKVSNRSDIDASLKYEITGPITSPSLGVGGEVVALTGATIPAGATWTIDTDPARPYIRDKATGANKMRTVYDTKGGPFVWNNRLAAGARDAPIALAGGNMTAATRVKVLVPRRYRMGIA